jgi:hypothetical protein
MAEFPSYVYPRQITDTDYFKQAMFSLVLSYDHLPLSTLKMVAPERIDDYHHVCRYKALSLVYSSLKISSMKCLDSVPRKIDPLDFEWTDRPSIFQTYSKEAYDEDLKIIEEKVQELLAEKEKNGPQYGMVSSTLNMGCLSKNSTVLAFGSLPEDNPGNVELCCGLPKINPLIVVIDLFKDRLHELAEKRKIPDNYFPVFEYVYFPGPCHERHNIIVPNSASPDGFSFLEVLLRIQESLRKFLYLVRLIDPEITVFMRNVNLTQLNHHQGRFYPHFAISP